MCVHVCVCGGGENIYLSSFSALLSFLPDAEMSPRTSLETAPSRRRDILMRRGAGKKLNMTSKKGVVGLSLTCASS